ncbi:MAG: hypothetical protein H7A44_09220 [Opitutaceae bacterium]|nr:hypothetical protein [Cephaloticoccus sp.]MCP5530607.1 hypothetical protein [Opitutaceae bacterium]
MTKLAQVQEAILRLDPQEQQELRTWLLEEESPELLAAVDEGMRSLVEEPTVSLDEARRKIKAWTTR